MAKFDSETGRLAGMKSKRGPGKIGQALRVKVLDRLDIERLFAELDKCEGGEYVKLFAQVLNTVLPRMQSLKMEGSTIADALVSFRKMSAEEQSNVLSEINKLQNEAA